MDIFLNALEGRNDISFAISTASKLTELPFHSNETLDRKNKSTFFCGIK